MSKSHYTIISLQLLQEGKVQFDSFLKLFTNLQVFKKKRNFWTCILQCMLCKNKTVKLKGKQGKLEISYTTCRKYLLFHILIDIITFFIALNIFTPSIKHFPRCNNTHVGNRYLYKKEEKKTFLYR